MEERLGFANFIHFNCSVSRKKPQISNSWIDCLPPELLQLILTFYTNKYQGIIHFSTVCRQWKEIGDYSFAWLTCELSFYCPDEYYRMLSPYNNVSLKKSFGDGSPVWISFHEENIFYSSDRLKFILNRPYIAPGTIQSYQQAVMIREKFMKIFIKFHQLWDWHCRWRSWAKSLEIQFDQFFEKFYAKFCFFIGLLTQGAAAYLLSSVQNHSSSLSVMNYAGFVCLYVYILLFIVLFFIGIVCNLHYVLSHPKNHDLSSHLQWRRIFPLISIELVIFGVLFSMILFQIKLANGASNLLYSYITIPMWLTILPALVLSISWFHKETFSVFLFPAVLVLIGIAVFSIPLGLTTIALYYDSPSHFRISSLQYAIIPLYPAELSIALIAAASLVDNYFFFHNYWTRDPFYSNPIVGFWKKLLFNGVRSLLLVGMLVIMGWFDVMITLDSLSLGQAIVCFIVLVTLFYLTVYCIAVTE